VLFLPLSGLDPGSRTDDRCQKKHEQDDYRQPGMNGTACAQFHPRRKQARYRRQEQDNHSHVTYQAGHRDAGEVQNQSDAQDRRSAE
jgi:hypothetical protein